MHRDGEVRAAPGAETGPRLVSRNLRTSEPQTLSLKRKTLNENNARSEKSFVKRGRVMRFSSFWEMKPKSLGLKF